MRTIVIECTNDSGIIELTPNAIERFFGLKAKRYTLIDSGYIYTVGANIKWIDFDTGKYWGREPKLDDAIRLKGIRKNTKMQDIVFTCCEGDL